MALTEAEDGGSPRAYNVAKSFELHFTQMVATANLLNPAIHFVGAARGRGYRFGITRGRGRVLRVDRGHLRLEGGDRNVTKTQNTKRDEHQHIIHIKI